MYTFFSVFNASSMLNWRIIIMTFNKNIVAFFVNHYQKLSVLVAAATFLMDGWPRG